MIRYTKDDFALMARKRIHAFMEISRTLGKDHPICQIMGPLGWGRHNMEQGPDTSLQGTIEEKAYLDGCFHILCIWAGQHDHKAQRVMLDLYPTCYESVK